MAANLSVLPTSRSRRSRDSACDVTVKRSMGNSNAILRQIVSSKAQFVAAPLYLSGRVFCERPQTLEEIPVHDAYRKKIFCDDLRDDITR